MKKLSLLSGVILAFLFMAAITPAQNPPTGDSGYGPYPKDYQKIVNRWLEKNLVDAPSAIIEWLGEPKPANLPTKEGGQLQGYLVEFKVNSRNRFGAYTGKQKHSALIRDGEVIKAIGF